MARHVLSIFSMASLAFIAPIALSTNVAAQPAQTCMGRMTQGKPGGDHIIVFAVPPEKVETMSARGFVRSACKRPKDMAVKAKEQMCVLAGRSTPEVETEFARMYGVTPREVCEL
jgi:hypothetical protein